MGETIRGIVRGFGDRSPPAGSGAELRWGPGGCSHRNSVRCLSDERLFLSDDWIFS